MIIENTNTSVYRGSLYIGRGAAVDALDNPQTSLASYGRRHRARYQASINSFRVHFKVMCTQFCGRIELNYPGGRS